MSDPDPEVRALLPERLDRPLRLGPFPSARDALKFLAWTAVGALLVPSSGPAIVVPFGLAGLGVAIVRIDGRAPDDWVVRLLRWQVRRLGGRELVTPSGTPRSGERSIVRRSDSLLAVVRTAGVPLAYLPPAELARRFELYRDLLRALGGPAAIHAARTPIHPAPYLPAEPAPPGAEGVSRAGYRELVGVIVRRRSLRQVCVAIGQAGTDARSLSALEARTAELIGRLRALGLRPTRLRGHAVEEALHRMGIRVEGRR
ncbi:MAG TPA: hypothetical protein VML53_05705 [Thermoplasmata archaeon]|nr:hypothetical protein [Thermoplasmata archaeon]